MTDQLPLLFQVDQSDPRIEQLRALLAQHGHLTREDLLKLTGWKDRDVRAVAAAMGDEIIRGQK